MTTALSPKLVAILRLFVSTTYANEKATARRKAETIARAAGMSFDEALHQHITLSAPGPVSQNHRAKAAPEPTPAEAAALRRRAEIIARYGSAANVYKWTQKEQLIIDALAPWRVVDAASGWTQKVKGWTLIDTPPAAILNAARRAYALPQTYAAALAEHELWIARDADLAGLDLRYDERGNALDLAVQVRVHAIRMLVEHGAPASTLIEVLDRVRRYRTAGGDDDKMINAIECDLAALIQSGVSASINPCEPAVDRVLKATPGATDREIARQAACSPTTVAKARKRLGLEVDVRIVRRNGQTYRVRSRR